jgi:hypothetical protein
VENTSFLFMGKATRVPLRARKANYTFGGRHFSSQREVLDLIQTWKQELGTCSSVKTAHPEAFAFLSDLFQHHHEWATYHQEGIVDFVILSAPPSGFKLSVQTACRIENVHWNHCVVPKNPRSTLLKAFRYAVRDQIQAFRGAHSSDKCSLQGANCKQEGTQVDHHTPTFAQLVSGFERLHPVVPTQFHECPKSFRLEDRAFEEAWTAYHRGHATLRMLCGPCNGSDAVRAANAGEYGPSPLPEKNERKAARHTALRVCVQSRKKNPIGRPST